MNRTHALLGLALLVACGEAGAPGRGETGTGGPSAAVERAPADDSAPGPAVTPTGVRVSLEWPAAEVRAGMVSVTIRTEGTGKDVVPRSVDVLSPTMPMHGVIRVPVSERAPNTFTAEVPLVMEGRWALFVNLDDDGGESVEFQLDVLPSPSREASVRAGIGGDPPPE